MLDTLTSINYRDFGPRYTHTFGWLHNGDTRKLVYVLRTEDSKVFFTDQTGMEYHAKIDAGVMFEFIPVDHGWFNASNGDAYLLSRTPARQWKRGISDSNTTMTSLNTLRLIGLNYNSLSNIFNDQFDERNYPRTFGAGALSKHFALRRHPYNQLYMYDRMIGTLDGDTIVLASSLFEQELTDLITRNGWAIKIKVTEG